MSKANEALDRMAENARQVGLDYEPTPQEPAPLRDAIVVNLVREGINKHRARELADHFIGLTSPPAQQQEPVQETLQQQLEKAKTALYNARADTRRIQQIIMRQS